MDQYDAELGPDAGRWLALDESERIALVEDHHEEVGDAAELPNARLHAAIHVIVENQIALRSETVVPGVLERLMTEGLDRHDAIRAIGSVLAEEMSGGMRDPDAAGDLVQDYYAKLERLTAEGWRSGAE